MGGRKRPATLKKSSGVRPKAPAISRTSPVGVYASVFVALVSALLYVFGSFLLGIHGDVHEDEVTATGAADEMSDSRRPFAPA